MRDLDDCFFHATNGELTFCGGINLPITVRHQPNPCILMITFIIIHKHEKLIMAMGVDDLQQYGAMIQLGENMTYQFQGDPTVYHAHDGQSRIEEILMSETEHQTSESIVQLH